MEHLVLLGVGIVMLLLGAFLGYFARQSIAKRDHKALETKVQKRLDYAKKRSREILQEAKRKHTELIENARKETEEKSEELFKREKFILKRENSIDQKVSEYEKKEKTFNQKVKRLKEIKEEIERMKREAEEELVRVSGMSEEEAKEKIYEAVEKEYGKDIELRMQKLEEDGEERYATRAREILAYAIQRYASDEVQEITTTNVALPDDEIKGRIIGKEGRNIRALEKATGVEVVVDDTPGVVVLSSFDSVRRHIAKIALEKLIYDGRIQPARIEEMVEKAEEEIAMQIRKAGESAVYEAGVINLNPKLVNLLGRLRFRASYGQNMLDHALEVSFLSGAIASEIGANVFIAKKAGLLHDIGKALDHQVEGSHVDIGIKVLEKFNVEKDVVTAMKSHHEEYPYESTEAVIIQTADAISAGRPGARKDTLENYLKRLEELETIANSFEGVDKSYAIQAGREIRVFVSPENVTDYEAKKMAKDVADRIQEELNYPGEIKIMVIRESRAISYAK